MVLNNNMIYLVERSLTFFIRSQKIGSGVNSYSTENFITFIYTRRSEYLTLSK